MNNFPHFIPEASQFFCGTENPLTAGKPKPLISTNGGCFKEMDLEDFLETHGFLNYDLLSENPVLGAKTVVFDDEVG